MFRTLALIVSAGTFSAAPAAAHHSRAAYDLTKEVVIEGTVAELAWKNPHIFVTVEARDTDGKPYGQEVEVTSVSEASALGLPREALAPGARVTLRAHPGRGGPGSRAVGLVVTSADGTAYPLNTDARISTRPAAVPAQGIAGHWAPTLESFGGLFAVMRSAPLTAAARAVSEQNAAATGAANASTLGICEPFPPPVLSIFPDVRTIEVDGATITLRFEGAVGVPMERVVHLNQQHPAAVTPSLMGHSIGRFEGETLVVDTVGFLPHRNGGLFVPSGPDKHLVERLTLSADRRQLEYAFTLEDPLSLTAPLSYTATWNHRPDLELSGEACDPEIAQRPLRD
jgi:hypothetical protein